MITVAEEKASVASCQRSLQDAEQVALRVTKALEDTRKECQDLRRQAGEVRPFTRYCILFPMHLHHKTFPL
jgi:hypothetical protein